MAFGLTLKSTLEAEQRKVRAAEAQLLALDAQHKAATARLQELEIFQKAKLGPVAEALKEIEELTNRRNQLVAQVKSIINTAMTVIIQDQQKLIRVIEEAEGFIATKNYARAQSYIPEIGRMLASVRANIQQATSALIAYNNKDMKSLRQITSAIDLRSRDIMKLMQSFEGALNSMRNAENLDLKTEQKAVADAEATVNRAMNIMREIQTAVSKPQKGGVAPANMAARAGRWFWK